MDPEGAPIVMDAGSRAKTVSLDDAGNTIAIAANVGRVLDWDGTQWTARTPLSVSDDGSQSSVTDEDLHERSAGDRDVFWGVLTWVSHRTRRPEHGERAGLLRKVRRARRREGMGHARVPPRSPT